MATLQVAQRSQMDESTSPITPRSSRRLMGFQSFLHHLDEAYDAQLEKEKAEHGGVLDEESQQRLLSENPVPFDLDSSSSSSDDEDDEDSHSPPILSPVFSPKQSTSVTESSGRRRSDSGISSTAPSAAILGATASASSTDTVPAKSSPSSKSTAGPFPSQNTGMRIPLGAGSRSQTLISPITGLVPAPLTKGSPQRDSSVSSLKSFWEKINEKEKEEADRLRVKPATATRSSRLFLPTALGSSGYTSAEGAQTSPKGHTPPVSPKVANGYATLRSPPTSPKVHAAAPVSHSNLPTQEQSPSILSTRPASVKKIDIASITGTSVNASSKVSPTVAHKHFTTEETTAAPTASIPSIKKTDEIATISVTSTDSQALLQSNDSSSNDVSTQTASTDSNATSTATATSPRQTDRNHAENGSTTAEAIPTSPRVADATVTGTVGKKISKSSKARGLSPQTSSSDFEPTSPRSDLNSPDSKVRTKRGSSKTRSRSPRGAEVGSEIVPSASSESLSSASAQRSQTDPGAASPDSADSPIASAPDGTSRPKKSKSPSPANNATYIEQSHRLSDANDRGVQSDAEGYAEKDKKKKKSSTKTSRANSTSHIPKTRLSRGKSAIESNLESPSKESKKSSSKDSVADSSRALSSPTVSKDRSVSPSPNIDNDIRAESTPKGSRHRGSDASATSSKESSKDSGKLSSKDSPKDPKSKLKKKMKRGSSKSKDSESTGAGGVSESNSPISGAKAGRKKKSKKKDIIEDDAEPAVVEQAKLTGASGQIELTKLRAFFATWDPNKAMTHSWEINPQEIEFVDMIGEGTSCAVYRGTYRGQVVALKVLKDLNTKQLTNFVKEFDIISDVRSPHVVFFFGACLDPVPVMVLGLCARGSLYDVLRAPDTVLTWASVFKVCISALKGLDSLHKWKPQIVHRDLKSRNILIEDDWAAKLCDFGESRYTTGTNIDTLCKIRGTYAYIAPEVYFGQSFTTKSDIYAFGVILWELCNRCVRGTYLAPFAEYKTLVYDFQIIVMASRKGMRPTIDPAIPSALSNLIRLCWDHEPANRPDTVQILRFFEEIAADSTRPAEWTKAKNVLEWPPAGGPGVAGSPPRTSGP